MVLGFWVIDVIVPGFGYSRWWLRKILLVVVINSLHSVAGLRRWRSSISASAIVTSTRRGRRKKKIPNQRSWSINNYLWATNHDRSITIGDVFKFTSTVVTARTVTTVLRRRGTIVTTTRGRVVITTSVVLRRRRAVVRLAVTRAKAISIISRINHILWSVLSK